MYNRFPKSWSIGCSWDILMAYEGHFTAPYAGWMIYTHPSLIKAVEKCVFEGRIKDAFELLK